MKEKISIIVAVYKAERFLDRCVNSLINQTYKNIEILLIDDGSPDNCPKLCDEWAQKDNRIRVVHKLNGGVSSAWNAGLDNATGEYISFVDSDDWVDSKYIEVLYDLIKQKNCDISTCCFYTVYNGKLFFNKKKPRFSKYFEAKDCNKLFFSSKPWPHNSWGKLYNRNIFNNLRYPEDIMCAEDLYVIYDICCNVKNGIITTDKILIYYFVHNASVTKTIDERRFDCIRSARHVVSGVEAKADNEIMSEACRRLFFEHRGVYWSFLDHKCKNLIKKQNEWLKEDYKKYAKYLKGKERLRNFIFRYFRPVYIFTRAIIKLIRR